jgi:hypothetical protein
MASLCETLAPRLQKKSENYQEIVMTKIITPGLTLADDTEASRLLRNPSLAGTQPAPEANPLGDRPLPSLEPEWKKALPERKIQVPHPKDPFPGADEDVPDSYLRTGWD